MCLQTSLEYYSKSVSFLCVSVSLHIQNDTLCISLPCMYLHVNTLLAAPSKSIYWSLDKGCTQYTYIPTFLQQAKISFHSQPPLHASLVVSLYFLLGLWSQKPQDPLNHAHLDEAKSFDMLPTYDPFLHNDMSCCIHFLVCVCRV